MMQKQLKLNSQDNDNEKALNRLASFFMTQNENVRFAQESVSVLEKKNPKIILCGDYNIAHQEIDIHDPKGNKNSSGFLPKEKEWMTKFLSSGWVDTFREFHEEAHRYSWWSQRFPSVRLNNKGWRIDYFTVTEPLRKNLVDADIFPDIKHSDHCPIFLEIKK